MTTDDAERAQWLENEITGAEAADCPEHVLAPWKAELAALRAAEQPAHGQWVDASYENARPHCLVAEQPAPEKGETLLRLEIELLSMETLKPGGTVTNIYVHENSNVVVRGTNERSIGWFDVGQAFKGKVYRHHVVKQPSHPADAGSGEDEHAFVAKLRDRSQHYSDANQFYIRNRAADLITRLTSDLSAAREQIAALDREWKRGIALVKDYDETLALTKAERDALSQEVARAYEECAKIAENCKFDSWATPSPGSIAAAIRAASLARGE